MLDLIDETFHPIPLTITPFIVVSLLYGSRMRRNHDFDALVQQAVHKRLRRIASISDNPLKSKACNQAFRLCDVMRLPRTQTETQRPAQAIHRYMNLAAKAPATAPHSLLLTFFGRRRHRDERGQSYYRVSRFLYRGPQQRLSSSVSKRPCPPSGQSACKSNSIFRIRLAANAIARHCGLSTHGFNE